MEEPQLLSADPMVVSPFHVRIMRAVAKAEQAYGSVDLRLEGGTALSAYYLMHRQSEDLDFFGGPQLNAGDFRSFVESLLTADGLHVVSQGPASQGFAEFLIADRPAAVPALERQNVKVQFGRASSFYLFPPLPTQEGPRVASYRDVCAGKLHAICDRYEPRDFIDLHCILNQHTSQKAVPDEIEQRRRIRTLIADLEASDPGLTEVHVGQALARGLQRPIISEFPLRLLIPIEEEVVRRTIRLGLLECAQLTRERAHWDEG